MEFHLTIGEKKKLKSFFMGSWSIAYAGMPSERVFSIALIWSLGQNSAAYNLFLPADQRRFTLMNRRVVVSEVSPSAIRGRVEK
jgi:hypothetical protein